MNLVTTLSDRIGVLEADLMKDIKKHLQFCLYHKLILRFQGQGRKLSDEEVQEKASTNTELFIQEVTPNEVIQYQEGSEKASDDLLLAGGTVTYSNERSSEKRSRQYKVNSHNVFEEKPNKKNQEKIDWNDPSVIRYHSLKMKPKTIAQARRNMIKYLKNQGNYKISDFKGMSYNDIRPIFEKIWDFKQNIEPMDTKHGSGKQKSPQKSPEKSPKEMKSAEKMEEMKWRIKELEHR
ncbi:hypothetical protein Tco_0448463 [Tanacetum coccineum]